MNIKCCVEHDGKKEAAKNEGSFSRGSEMANRKAKQETGRRENVNQELQKAVKQHIKRTNCGYIEALRAVTRSDPRLWNRYKNGLQEVQPNLREAIAMKAKARGILLRLVACLDKWGPRDKHFGIGHQASSVVKAAQRVVVFPDEPYERVADVMKELTETAYRILETTAHDKAVANSDLDVLTTVLSRHQDPIRFRPVPLTDPRSMFRRKGGVDIAFVEDLLSYLDLSARYGRQHHVCQFAECHSLMISGRGGKKFCSNTCRNKFWSYDRQKPYYLDSKEKSERRAILKKATG
jgi:hypothetical protein